VGYPDSGVGLEAVLASYARVPVGQSQEVTQKALEAIELTQAHANYALVDQIKRVVPFRHILISGLDIDGYAVGTGTYLLSDFPVGYLAEYYSGDYIETDPLVKLFKCEHLITRDSDAFSSAEAVAIGESVRALLKRYGIVERTIVRVVYAGRVCGSITVISDEPLSESHCQLLQNLALSLHAPVSRPALFELNGALRLTKGELYCLSHAARGLTSEGIAHEDTYSVETINSYLKSATRKLGALNRTQAVAEALRRQLIQ
jgi:DNA-binding CsgD family transcriptional regulator